MKSLADEFIKDFAVITGGALTGLVTDQLVGIAWFESGLPLDVLPPPLQQLHIDDILVLVAEGLGAWYLDSIGEKDLRNFVIGMFAEAASMEVYEALVANGIIYPPASPPVVVGRLPAGGRLARKFIPGVLTPKYQLGNPQGEAYKARLAGGTYPGTYTPTRPGEAATIGARPAITVGPYAGGITAPKFVPGVLRPKYMHGA